MTAHLVGGLQQVGPDSGARLMKTGENSGGGKEGGTRDEEQLEAMGLLHLLEKLPIHRFCFGIYYRTYLSAYLTSYLPNRISVIYLEPMSPICDRP